MTSMSASVSVVMVTIIVTDVHMVEVTVRMVTMPATAPVTVHAHVVSEWGHGLDWSPEVW